MKTHSCPCASPFHLGAFLSLALGLMLGLGAHAATQTVTSTADSGTGSLRGTLATAAPGDTVVFDASLSGQTITLASSLTLAQNVTIDASALPGGLILSGNNTVAILNISANTVTAVLKSLTLSNGRVVSSTTAQGAGISNAGTLTLNQCVVRNCVCNKGATAGISRGAGIYNSGTLTLNQSTVQNCSATSGVDGSTSLGQPARGGGIYNDTSGVLSLANSTIQNNSATGGNGKVGTYVLFAPRPGYTGGNGEGGGIYSAGTISICSQNTFAGNSVTGGAGGAGASATAEPAGIGANGAGGIGGGIYNAGLLALVSQCTFSGNSATGGAGGRGGLLVQAGGTAKSYAGAVGGNGGDGTGGGIYNQNAGTLSIRQSTFSGNSVLGGLAGDGSGGWSGNATSAQTSPGAGGNGARGGDGGSGGGGGIGNAGAIPLFTQCTFSGNAASGNDGGSGGDGGDDDAGGGSPKPGGDGGDGGNGGDGLGAHLYNLGAITLLSQSTFSGSLGSGGDGGIAGTGGAGCIANSQYFGGIGGDAGTGGNGGNGASGGNGGDSGIINISGGGYGGGTGGSSNISGQSSGNGGNGGPGGRGGDGGSSGIYNAGTLAMSGSILASTTGSAGAGGRGGFAGLAGTVTSPATVSGVNGSAGKAGHTGSNTGADVGSVITSQGHNLLCGYDRSGGTFNGVASDLVFTSAVSVDPRLSALASNGGPTQTMALLPGSPAIDVGDDSLTDTVDQRGTGFSRRVGGHVDIGAYEFDALALGYTAPALGSQSAGSVTIAPTTGLGSLTVNASLNPNGLAATSYIEYGIGTSYGNATAPVAYGNGTSNVPVNLTLNGLSPGITWHYRVVTVTAAGTTYGTDQTVTVGAPGDVNGDGVVDLYSLSQVQALNVGVPLLQRDNNTGIFTLTIGVAKSTDLVQFNPFPITAPQINVDGQGRIQVQFTVPGNAAFFRLQSQ